MSVALVTGADGFIGSHLVQLLLDKGYHVKAFCQYNSFGSYGWLDSLPLSISSDIEYILGDIRDYQSILSAMKSVDTVFHLAALIAIPYSYSAPYSYVDTNIVGTLNVVQAARQMNVSKVVHTSTSETYGTAQFVPITEDHPQVGQSPYAASKIGADQLALSFFHSFSTPVTILRPFNTYGPRQSIRAVIPTIITQIASGRSEINLGALTPTRDFNYVYDTCCAFYSVAVSENTVGRIINSSSNFEISIGDTALLISRLMNSSVPIVSDEQRLRPANSEVNRLFGDNSRLLELTDWSPKFTGLTGFEKGLINTIDWFVDPKNLSMYSNLNYTL